MMLHDRDGHATAWVTAVLPFLAASLGCGSSGPAESLDAMAADLDVPTVDAVAAAIDGGTCMAEVASHPNGGHLHTDHDCDPVTYATNPPSSGTHYDDWAAYQTYASPVPWGFLVHDLEHGAVVVVYNCPGGCADEVAQAQALIDSLPPDTGCGGARPNIVLAPDPTLDTRWAASAWTWTLRASCYDGPGLAAFIAAHYHGPDTEAACGGGVDRSASGWCP